MKIKMRRKICLLFLTITSLMVLIQGQTLTGIVANSYSDSRYTNCFFRNETFNKIVYSVEPYGISETNRYLNESRWVVGNSDSFSYSDSSGIMIAYANLYSALYPNANPVTSLVYSFDDVWYEFFLFNKTFDRNNFLTYNQKGLALIEENEKTFLLFFDQNGISNPVSLSLTESPIASIANEDAAALIILGKNNVHLLDVDNPLIEILPRRTTGNSLCGNSYLFVAGEELFNFYDLESPSILLNSTGRQISTCGFYGSHLYIGGNIQATNQNYISIRTLSTLEEVYFFEYPAPILTPNRDYVNKILPVVTQDGTEIILAVSKGTKLEDMSCQGCQPELFVIFPKTGQYVNFITYGELSGLDFTTEFGKKNGNFILICGLQDLYVLRLT